MRIRICMLGMALIFGGVSEGGLLPLSAAESIQVVTRGKPERPDRDRPDHHRKVYKKKKNHQNSILRFLCRKDKEFCQYLLY